MKTYLGIFLWGLIGLPVSLLLTGILTEAGRFWGSIPIIAAILGIMALYGTRMRANAMKRSWLEKADLGNGPWWDPPRSLDCYPDGNATSGSSTDGDEQDYHVQEGFGHIRERGRRGARPG
jgi:hypothetical protein